MTRSKFRKRESLLMGFIKYVLNCQNVNWKLRESSRINKRNFPPKDPHELVQIPFITEQISCVYVKQYALEAPFKKRLDFKAWWKIIILNTCGLTLCNPTLIAEA